MAMVTLTSGETVPLEAFKANPAAFGCTPDGDAAPEEDEVVAEAVEAEEGARAFELSLFWRKLQPVAPLYVKTTEDRVRKRINFKLQNLIFSVHSVHT